MVSEGSTGSTKQLQYQYVRVDWGDSSVGTIAKRHGFEEVYYADLRTLRVLGVWTQQFVTIYGKRSQTK